MVQDYIYIIAMAGIASSVSFAIYYHYKKLKAVQEELEKTKIMMNKILVEKLMFNEESQNEELFKESVSTLAKKLFLALKRRYSLRSADYNELVEDLQKLPLKEDFKQKLIEFFNAVILLEYSNSKLSDSKKKQLKKQAIELIRLMGQFQTIQE